jgi:hypothetical protein
MDFILKMTAFWDIAPCSLEEIDYCFRGAYCLYHQGTLLMDTVSTFEISVSFYKTTQCSIPEGCHLHTTMRT